MSLPTLPLELRQNILSQTLTPCTSYDPVLWSESETSQEKFIVNWAITLKLVNKSMGEDVAWVEKGWRENLVREKEERYRGWWGGLERFVRGGDRKGGVI